MSFTNFTPDIGLRGSYVLKPPFRDLVNPLVMFTCKGLNKISKLIGDGVDVYGTYYEAYGLDENTYDEDVALDRNIVTIVSDGGVYVWFPTGYLESFPNQNGQPYEIRNLQIHLPPFPIGKDLSYMYPLIQELIQRELGVPQVAIQPVVASDMLMVPFEQHEAMMADRKATAQVSTPTVDARYWRQQFEDCDRQLKQLLSLP